MCLFYSIVTIRYHNSYSNARPNEVTMQQPLAGHGHVPYRRRSCDLLEYSYISHNYDIEYNFLKIKGLNQNEDTTITGPKLFYFNQSKSGVKPPSDYGAYFLQKVVIEVVLGVQFAFIYYIFGPWQGPPKTISAPNFLVSPRTLQGFCAPTILKHVRNN